MVPTSPYDRALGAGARVEVTSRAEPLRRVVHVAVGLPAFFLDRSTVTFFIGACVAGAVFNAVVLRLVPIFREVRDVPRGSAGTVLYPATLAVLLVLFRDRPELVKVGWIMLAFGDGLVPLFARLGGPRWPTVEGKRVIPSVFAAACAALVAWPATDWKLAFAGAAAAVFADAIPRVDDNIAWPVLGVLGAWGAYAA